jgi:hypothetical protein
MSVNPHATRTRLILAVAAGVAGAVSFAGPASAKEGAGVVTIAPGVVPAPSSACSPVKSFKHSSTTGVGDTGLSSVSADYQVKPCDSKESVTVEVKVAQEFDPTNVLRDDTDAPLSGKVSVLGVQLETWYRITITVRDAVTGQTVGSASALEIAHRPTGA